MNRNAATNLSHVERYTGDNFVKGLTIIFLELTLGMRGGYRWKAKDA
ncbi:MAG: hypothetical protein IBX69_14415 [Anaerolineales bacterium]|nr:hypothetical protein [Anaerolineales bacterium]